mmetsp:Transcript_41036/g.60229  ORF Transcript_41036/g.60229 Transcript_41036/m.60229 type:complete len:431 (+) Transcript_41036:83-1375(+)
MYFSRALGAIALFSSPLISVAEVNICRGKCQMDANGIKECIFTMKVDLFAGELGYYTVEECGNGRNPTLGIEHGVTNKFLQTDVSNYYHPLGLAYYVDGAHKEVDELEPTIMGDSNNIGSSCVDDSSCPAPMYFKNDEYLGTYSNDASIMAETTGEDNFGLDDYEPLFFYPLPAWREEGDFHVTLKYDEKNYTKDIFYFCHIHHGMSGVIKFIDSNGIALSTEKNELEIRDDYYDAEPSGFDATCGTFNLTDYQLPNQQCPDRFVCDLPEGNPELIQFSQCIEAMDCHMVVSMTNKVQAQDQRALFIHQMIPHHQNAVNMAKALMKSGKLNCDDILEENSDCQLEVILREIVNNQNFQIQAMKSILEANNWPLYDDCKVPIDGVDNDGTNVAKPDPDADMRETDPDSAAGSHGLDLFISVCALAITIALS